MQAPVDDLVTTLERVVPGWLERCVTETAERRLGACPEPLRIQARQMAETVGPSVVAEVERLVRTDVDEQRGTPLTVLRAAVRHPTDLLSAAAVEAPHRDPFAEEHFPADRYDLSPASWSDIDPALHDPGIMWGAWKAATVIRRRRPGGDSPDAPTMT
ncbi:hypothetical protein BH23ACT3_BH23ACT3_12170 [soil metagenome]